MESALRDDVNRAVALLVERSGHGVDALFGDRVIDDFATLPSVEAYAAGFIEGIALAMGVTVIEMLDRMDKS